MTTLAEQSPVEIDTVLAALWGEQQKLEVRLANDVAYLTKAREWDRPRVEESIAKGRARLAEVVAEAVPLQTEYVRRGCWNRYFLVINSNGHVHRGMDCGTCFPSTQYAWLVDLADCDEAVMVEEWGEKACTRCFPGAPSNPNFYRPSRLDREAAEVREAEKAARDAEKAEKAITDVDGSLLRVGYDILRTKVAASRALSGAIKSYAWYGSTHPSNFDGQIKKLVAALTHAGIDPQPIIARAVKASAKEGAKHTWEG